MKKRQNYSDFEHRFYHMLTNCTCSYNSLQLYCYYNSEKNILLLVPVYLVLITLLFLSTLLVSSLISQIFDDACIHVQPIQLDINEFYSL